MMKSNFGKIFLIICISLAACQKVIHVDLNNAPSQLVIDADMSNVTGLKVTLTKSVGFYENNSFPTVDNAVVILKNMTTNKVDTVQFKGSGIYSIKRIPVVGNTYQLSIIVDSAAYIATSTMPSITTLDSITFTQSSTFGENIISAQVNFQDKAGEDNYYLFKEHLYKNGGMNSFPFSDRLSDGRYIQYVLRNDSSYIAIGDSVRITMQCIDKNAYNYFSVVQTITADDNGFGSASPSNPPSNIIGNALGLFSVHSDYTKVAKVPNNVPKE